MYRITTTALSIGANQDSSVKLAGRAIQLKNKIKLPDTITTIGTWNVRTLRRCGKIHELTNELDRYQLDIVGLSETRMTGSGELTTDAGHKLFYSGQDKHFEGVGFIVRKELTKAVINYSVISSRIISIRIKASPINMTIIQVYAPTTSHSYEEIEEFYETIEKPPLTHRRKTF